MWTYIRESIRTHPFNFFTLTIALVAAGFAGWSAYEAHQTRIGADKAAVDQLKDVERARKAAEKSADAAQDLVKAATDNLRLASESLGLNKTLLLNEQKSFYIQQRPYLSPSVLTVHEPAVGWKDNANRKGCCTASVYAVSAINNLGNTPAYEPRLTFPIASNVFAQQPFTNVAPKDSVRVEDGFVLPFINLEEFRRGMCRICSAHFEGTLQYYDVFGKQHNEATNITISFSLMSQSDWTGMMELAYRMAGQPIPHSFELPVRQ